MLPDELLMQRQEVERRTTRLHYESLGSSRDPALDTIAQLAAEICSGPGSLVSIADDADAEEKLHTIVAAFQNVTARCHLDRMKDEFISTVSHELRTPLTSLRAALGLLAGGGLSERPEKTAQMLNLAVVNCDRLTRLVNDILDFERVESGRSNLRCAVHRASDLLYRAAEAMQESATMAGVRFRIKSDWVEVWADRDRIVQTLTNLIANSIKAAAPNSEIQLNARLNSTKMVQIEVHDQGRGIPADKLDIIFERFQQVDSSDSRVLGGTGMGLAICRSIVRKHGGDIWAESVLGTGSTFYLTLPTPDPHIERRPR